MEGNQKNGNGLDKVSPHPLKAILLVDDDKALAEALQSALVEENFLVDVAHDGEEALLKIKINEYDAVVADLLMPNLRGDQLFDKVRVMRPKLARRFVFTTGYPTAKEVTQFLERSNAPCLVKPFHLSKLITSLRELLAG